MAYSREILEAAKAAKADQVAAIAAARAKGDLLAAYWAGSVSASVAHHYRRGAVKQVRAA